MATLKSTLLVGEDKVYPKTSSDQVTFQNSTVQARINSLLADTAALQESINALDARIAALETEQAALSETVSSLDTRVTSELESLDARVTALEGNE